MTALDGRLVLMVEDDPATARMYSLRLRRDGCQVVVAENAAAAEREFAAARPDVVLADSRLPGGSGSELAGRLAGHGAPVILLTNDQHAYDRAPSGVRALIKARTSPARLSAVITEVLSGSSP
ncbi:MAG: response regulator [Candidatus Dormibacteraeota bacterium]|nr:response regulator [Candidatus Dormibacteraeota bacterium]